MKKYTKKQSLAHYKKRKISNQRVQMRQIDLENMRMSLKDEDNGLN